MRASHLIRFCLPAAFLLFLACKKNLDKKESEIPNDSPNFLILEEVADTSSLTDTALALNDIQFDPGNTYDSIIWTIDNGSFRRKEKILRLKFLQEGIYNVKMTGYRFAPVLDSSISESVIKTIHIVTGKKVQIIREILKDI